MQWFIVFGTNTDNSKLLGQYRSNLIQEHNEFQTKYLYDWGFSAVSSAHDLILGILYGLLYLHVTDFHYMCDSRFKNLPQFCKIDGIPLKMKISNNEARMIFGSYLFNRKISESIEIQSLNVQINTWFYEGSKTRRPCLISIDRNSICLANFTSEIFHSKVELDSKGFLTTTFRSGLIDKTITTLVLSMDQRDGEE